MDLCSWVPGEYMAHSRSGLWASPSERAQAEQAFARLIADMSHDEIAEYHRKKLRSVATRPLAQLPSRLSGGSTCGASRT